MSSGRQTPYLDSFDAGLDSTSRISLMMSDNRSVQSTRSRTEIILKEIAESDEEEDQVYEKTGYTLHAEPKRDIWRSGSGSTLHSSLLRNNRKLSRGKPVYDEHSPSTATKGTLKYPLRERLLRLSRSQRRSLLLTRAGAPVIAVDHPDDDGDEELTGRMAAYYEQELRAIVRHESILDRDDEEHEQDPVTVVDTHQGNSIKLHVYDLIAHDTLMQLPWGCVCEIGKCFNEFNSALHKLGTGAYHVGIEVNGIEYAYGATHSPGRTGVFTCIPKLSPGYQYRTTIDFGKRPLLKTTWAVNKLKGSSSFLQKVEHVEGRQVIKDMAQEYMGIDYDILRRNCCTFARDACLRLGIEEREIPTWFRNLAESGAMTQDLALATVLPLANVLSNPSLDEDDEKMDEDSEEDGFEVVPAPKKLRVGDNDRMLVLPSSSTVGDSFNQSFRRISTWAY